MCNILVTSLAGHSLDFKYFNEQSRKEDYIMNVLGNIYNLRTRPEQLDMIFFHENALLCVAILCQSVLFIINNTAHT